MTGINSKQNRYIIWADHKKAIIGKFDERNRFSHLIIRSNIETRHRFPGETTNKIRLSTSTRNRQTFEQNKFHQQLADYVKKIIGSLENVLSLLIIGPADTKYVLHKETENKKQFEGVEINVQPADKLTLPMLQEKGREYYRIPAPPRGLRRRRSLLLGN
ncbi:MAG: hypothetical protein GC171_14915 [Terrimonas sp.]|nr:hypothetical protein [Terrimonas sp.]